MDTLYHDCGGDLNLQLVFPHFQYDLFLAGTDTSRAFIEWTLYYMATAPDIQEKIYREIQEKVGDRFPRVSDKLSIMK